MKRQTVKDFVWLIVDDGSADGTRELVDGWMKEDNGFVLHYVYQENGGMHSAHNLAYENISTEINTCIDSDDFMPDDAVEKIINFWTSCDRDERVSGILALDSYSDGKIIGTRLPENIRRARSYDYYYKYGVTGDKKFILRTDLTKKNPYPVFDGEKYVNLATKYSLLDVDYEMLAMNEVVCIVEYLDDGSSKNMFSQYFKNPKGFAYSRKLCMQLPYADFKFRFIQAMHYVSSCLISHNGRWLSESPRKALTLLAAPAGFIWWKYISRRVKQPQG